MAEWDRESKAPAFSGIVSCWAAAQLAHPSQVPRAKIEIRNQKSSGTREEFRDIIQHCNGSGKELNLLGWVFGNPASLPSFLPTFIIVSFPIHSGGLLMPVSYNGVA